MTSPYKAGILRVAENTLRSASEVRNEIAYRTGFAKTRLPQPNNFDKLGSKLAKKGLLRETILGKGLGIETSHYSATGTLSTSIANAYLQFEREHNTTIYENLGRGQSKADNGGPVLRYQILQEAHEGPVTESYLIHNLDAARTTIQRHLRTMPGVEKESWQDGNTYYATGKQPPEGLEDIVNDAQNGIDRNELAKKHDLSQTRATEILRDLERKTILQSDFSQDEQSKVYTNQAGTKILEYVDTLHNVLNGEQITIQNPRNALRNAIFKYESQATNLTRKNIPRRKQEITTLLQDDWHSTMEVAERVDLQRKTVIRYLHALEQEGKIQSEMRKPNLHWRTT